jgi:hypothetical protein
MAMLTGLMVITTINDKLTSTSLFRGKKSTGADGKGGYFGRSLIAQRSKC